MGLQMCCKTASAPSVSESRNYRKLIEEIDSIIVILGKLARYLGPTDIPQTSFVVIIITRSFYGGFGHVCVRFFSIMFMFFSMINLNLQDGLLT